MSNPTGKKRTVVTRRKLFPPLQRFTLQAGEINGDNATKEAVLTELHKALIHIDKVDALVASMRGAHRSITRALKQTNKSLLQQITGWTKLVEQLEEERNHWHRAATISAIQYEEAQEAMSKLNARILDFMEARRDTMAILRDEFRVVVKDYNAGYMTSVQQRVERLYESFDAFVNTAQKHIVKEVE